MPAKRHEGQRSSKRTAAREGKRPTTKTPPRKDKGNGEAAVQARIAALAEPSRSILARLHPMVMRHATGLDPVVRYGFAIYLRGGKMVLVAAPRKAYVTFGYTNDAGIDREPVKFTSADQVDEATVASFVERLQHGTQGATLRTAGNALIEADRGERMSKGWQSLSPRDSIRSSKGVEFWRNTSPSTRFRSR